MKASTVVISVLTVLSAGLATGIVTTVSRNRELTAQLEETQPASSQPALAADTSRLRQLLEDQELANAALRDELAELQRRTTNDPARPAPTARVTNPDRQRNQTRQGGSAWLDRLKQEDPERYKQMVQAREQRRKAAEQWLQDTVAQLDQRAATATTKQESEVATAIADTLVKLNELRSQWEALRNLPEDQRQALSQELQTQMRETQQTLRDLSQQDRTIQLENYARSLGYSDQPSLDGFVAGIRSIYSNTSYRAIVGGGPGGSPGEGNRGGGGWGGPPANAPPGPSNARSPTP